jgi:hypothetical protein
VGTVVGASLGELVMSSHALANSPAALAAGLAVVSAALGWAAVGALRVGVSLALFTFVSVVLCQYRGCCGATAASTAYFLTRMISVSAGIRDAGCVHPFIQQITKLVGLSHQLMMDQQTPMPRQSHPPNHHPDTPRNQVIAGCVWAAVVSNLVLPSYTSDWVIRQLAASLERCAALMADLYTHQYRTMRAAAIRAGLHAHGGGAEGGESAGASAVPAGLQGAQGAAGAGAEEDFSDDNGRVESAEEMEGRERALAARLRPEVVAPLLAVQAALERETVSWRRGPLATPRVARDVLAGLQVGGRRRLRGAWGCRGVGSGRGWWWAVAGGCVPKLKPTSPHPTRTHRSWPRPWWPSASPSRPPPRWPPQSSRATASTSWRRCTAPGWT